MWGETRVIAWEQTHVGGGGAYVPSLSAHDGACERAGRVMPLVQYRDHEGVNRLTQPRLAGAASAEMAQVNFRRGAVAQVASPQKAVEASRSAGQMGLRRKRGRRQWAHHWMPEFLAPSVLHQPAGCPAPSAPLRRMAGHCLLERWAADHLAGERGAPAPPALPHSHETRLAGRWKQ